MKILVNIILSVAILAAGLWAARELGFNPITAETGMVSAHGAQDHADEAAKGPHGGRLLSATGLQLEVTLYERGVPPEFHVYPYRDGKPLAPDTVSLQVSLSRLGGGQDQFAFSAREDYLLGAGTVTEPHSFDVAVSAEYAGESFRWEYAQHEGRTHIAADMARAAGIETALAGSAEIHETVQLQGIVRTDPGRTRNIRPRYAGVIRHAAPGVGDYVRSGQVLAEVESNESLQTYKLTAPINGIVLAQHAAAGEAIEGEPIYTIADLDRLWVDLMVFPGTGAQIAADQTVNLTTLDRQLQANGRIQRLLPLTDPHSQTTRARVVINNPDGAWRPGMAVNGVVTVRRVQVPLAVENRALQQFRDFTVVYAQVGEDYEVRMLDLGVRDATYTQVLGGLAPGTEYVVANSFLLKADIEKSGASHDH